LDRPSAYFTLLSQNWSLAACRRASRKPSINKEAFKRAEKELAGIRNIPGCRLLNWTEPEYPQKLLQIYDPPVLF